MQISQCVILAALAYSVHTAAFKNRNADFDSPSSAITLGKTPLSNDDAEPASHVRRRRGKDDPLKVTDGLPHVTKTDGLLVPLRKNQEVDLLHEKNGASLSSMLKLGKDMGKLDGDIATVSKPKYDVSEEELENLRKDLHSKPQVTGTAKKESTGPAKGSLLGMYQDVVGAAFNLEKIEKKGKS